MTSRCLNVPASLSAAAGHAAADSSALAEDALRRMPDVHPRLVVSGDGFERMRHRFLEGGDSLFSKGCRRLERDAEFYLGVPPVVHAFDDEMRMLATARMALARVTTLALAYRLTEREEFLRRAEAELGALAAFPDWNLQKHGLDAAEFCAAAALGLDWLHDKLKPELRGELRRAMRSYALEPAVRHLQAKDIWWARDPRSNWNQVLHGGFLAGALLLADTDPDLSTGLLASVIDYLPKGMAVYAPNGAYPEGPSYWVYGTSFNVLAIAMLDSALGNDFGLSQLPGFRVTADFPDMMTGTSGRFFNFSDGDSKRSLMVPIFWFARKLNRPELMEGFTRSSYLDYVDGAVGNEKDASVIRLFAVLLATMPEEPRVRTGLRLPFVYDSQGGNHVIVQRSSHDATNGVFVGLKGGSPSLPHGHMDAGSFVMDAGGVRWAEDLGAEKYGPVEAAGIRLWDRVQDGSRWSVYKLGLSGHNTLMLDGCAQWIAGEAQVTVLREGPTSAVSLDLSSLYTNATRVVRVGEMMADGRGYRISDRVEGLRAGASIRWTLHTRARVRRDGDGLLLEQPGASVRLRLSAVAPGGEWSFGETPHPHPWDTPNTGVTRVCLEMPMPAEGIATLVVTLAVKRVPSVVAEPRRRVGE